MINPRLLVKALSRYTRYFIKISQQAEELFLSRWLLLFFALVRLRWTRRNVVFFGQLFDSLTQLTDLINQFFMEVRALFLALIKGAFAAMQEKKYQSDKKQEKQGHQEHHEGHAWTITWGSPPHIHHPFPILSR